MGGLQRLFLRITPIIMLICFICFGITHTFQQERQPNITYLTHETIEVIADDPLTEENEQITIENYNFDFQSYRENIDQNILKRSINKTFDFTTYENVLNTYNEIWEDGYDFLDGVQTLTNTILLIINTLILPINIILVPLRITCGILLTAFSLIGINISRNTPIITALNSIIDNANIPMIEPTYNKGYNYVNGTTWIFNNTIRPSTDLGTEIDAYVTFNSEGGGNYVAMFTRNGTLYYKDTQGYEIAVYNSNGWIYQDSKKIINLNIDSLNNLQMRTFMAWLSANATKQ